MENNNAHIVLRKNIIDIEGSEYDIQFLLGRVYLQVPDIYDQIKKSIEIQELFRKENPNWDKRKDQEECTNCKCKH